MRVERARALALVLVLAQAGAALWPARAAHANGAFPDSLGVLLPSDQPDRIFVATNFGLVRSDDGGKSWRLICEEAVGAQASPYSLGAPPDDRLFAVTFDGVVLSTDSGCTWRLLDGPAAFATDVFADPSDPKRVLVVAPAGPNDAGGIAQGIFESLDGAESFESEPLFTTPPGFAFTGVEVARTDPAVIYATMATATVPAHSVIVTSFDSGAGWTTHELDAVGGRFVRILAIDPDDASLVYLRAYDTSSTEVFAVYDADTGASRVALSVTDNMSAFLRRSDGALIVGTRTQGAFISTDGAASFEPWLDAPHLRGLGEREGRLYGVADDFLDGYALGVSSDRGESWQSRLQLLDIEGPLSCGELEDTCELPWLFAQMQLDPAPGPGAITALDAGQSGHLGDADGSAVEPSAGCGCAVRAPAPVPPFVHALLGAILLRTRRHWLRARGA